MGNLIRGISFNGQNSLDLGLTMPNDPQIQFPSKIKNKLRIPGTNIIYDRNTRPFHQQFEEREIICTFNVINFTDITIEQTHHVGTKLINWLMGEPGKKRLQLDTDPHYYYMAEVEDVGDLETDLFEFGILEVVFTAMPYKERVVHEGHDIWNEFNFETDYAQEHYHVLPNMTTSPTFNSLSIGQMVNLGGWAVVLPGGQPRLRQHQTSPFYEITKKQSAAYDPGQGWYSRNQYQLDNGMWVREQDIVQARKEYIDITLRNTSNHSVKPRIFHQPTGSTGATWRGITIRREGKYYNLRGDTVGEQEYVNNIFELNPGVNNLRVYGQNNYVDFIWKQEVL